MKNQEEALPPELLAVRGAALSAMDDLVPAGPPGSAEESKSFFLSSWTKAGRDLPPHYLVHFLLIDLLGFPYLGRWEKVAWAVPVRLGGKLYGVEHRKMGMGVFAPNRNPSARSSGVASEGEESDAREIVRRIKRAVDLAAPYFEWRAQTAAKGRDINVVNTSAALFERYRFFCEQFELKTSESLLRREEMTTSDGGLPGYKLRFAHLFPSIRLKEEAEWSAQAAIEAFFGWTEHVFIHLAVLQGFIRTGEEVARLAAADWKTKFRTALDINDVVTKSHYDGLLTLRTQIRNYMAHGAFGKRGEAFSFHSGAGAVPVLLTRDSRHGYSLTGGPAFDEKAALLQIEAFVTHLWTGTREPAKEYMESEVPTVLTFASDGTYLLAMRSVDAMEQLIKRQLDAQERAANMDW
ncbi:hypothetical protein [Ralstonia flaminis]|jgi:hypothetical protein|uniref:Uncharacterized protein n=1 Tax=Ralstonia flaminis TaxID=3058597 RepID=A0ABM9K0B0_9RALS|nr:hypothetical protein [Ralstonia sp. LMG 18101]CAJ0809029.1 hypothetical protein LMG18101_00493 [Ralstonia sp. LMG 18101]